LIYLIHIRKCSSDNATLLFALCLYARWSNSLQIFTSAFRIWAPSFPSLFPFEFMLPARSNRPRSEKNDVLSTFGALLGSSISNSIGATLKTLSLFLQHADICHKSPIPEGRRPLSQIDIVWTIIKHRSPKIVRSDDAFFISSTAMIPTFYPRLQYAYKVKKS